MQGPFFLGSLGLNSSFRGEQVLSPWGGVACRPVCSRAPGSSVCVACAVLQRDPADMLCLTISGRHPRFPGRRVRGPEAGFVHAGQQMDQLGKSPW